MKTSDITKYLPFGSLIHFGNKNPGPWILGSKGSFKLLGHVFYGLVSVALLNNHVITPQISKGIDKLTSPPQISAFKTYDNHFSDAKFFANGYNRGVKKIGDNKDIDGDNMNDYYMICNNGKAYSTSSKRLLQGHDTAREKTWFETDKFLIDTAPKGEYEAR